ncbi:helix-turn-helix domain-containing protein [Janthinobacterium sp. FW305-129]|uniref:helix-turn-helix domain-containing protein n=1 Tax=Janthinobacterium sp. FW305-129 TaxID=2775054 RepID=UPI001E5F8862|nr:helix-turn-helix transcriptional regulator [Janthinobacterium sp. FW305-129]MCC7598470.1 helix-turn-helix domain-containing protein [Janthinobacterium sp. FW305-129]
MIGQIPTNVLKMAREKAALSQTELAGRLGVSASIVSRLESTEFADCKMAERYLSAIKTDLAAEIVEYYGERWRFIEQPPFTHTERKVIFSAEQALQSLDNFENSSQFDAILQDPLSKLRNRIIAETEFVRHREHGIAFIGDIGVGKTTALSFVTNLILTGKGGKPESVFPTGSGRTTVCEVAIKIAPAFGISVESLTEEAIRELVSDLVRGLKTGKSGLPSELERVIRNMADLRRTPVRPKAGLEKAKPIDELRDMVDATDDIDQVIADVLSKMKLDTRTEAQMILSEHTEGSIEWLASNIAKINYGQHPNFSVPQRITVLLPLQALRETPYLLSVIDTKGVEGTTQRSDLKAQVDDARTVVVLCSKFSDAPGPTPMSIMREMTDSGSDALEAGRICLLVLPREDEALKVIDDFGGNPLTPEDGYAVREAQIDQQFATEGLPSIPLNFYNVENDNPADVWVWLTSMINRIRENKIVRIERFVGAAHDLVVNSDIAKSRQARITIAETIENVVVRLNKLPESRKPAHVNLIAETKKAHQSSISASVNRRGKWENFNVPHILGVGVRADANLRTRDLFIRIDEQIEGLKRKFGHLLDINQLLESLQDDVTEWKQNFLAKAALTGRVSYSPHLESATELWSLCEQRYGNGTGYRVDISEIFQNHFEEDDGAINARNRVNASLEKSWTIIVIDPLLDAAKFDSEEI